MDKIYKTYFSTKASLMALSEGALADAATKEKKEKKLEHQKDLMKLVSILLSTGMNKNDDVFIKDEVLPARNTGAHKPLNIEHDESKIVGHMLRTYVTTKNGKVISDEDIDECPEDMPNDFDITSESVIYKYALPDVAQKVRQMVEDNKLFVSVEAWFTDYDYLVGSKIVKRNAKTEPVLDSVLRINGGEGVYNNNKVGRVLRHITIGGIGLTENPANPESVIKSISSIQASNIINSQDVIYNNIIGDVYQCKANIKDGSNCMDLIAREMKSVIDACLAQFVGDAESKVSETGSLDISAVYNCVKQLRDKINLLYCNEPAATVPTPADKPQDAEKDEPAVAPQPTPTPDPIPATPEPNPVEPVVPPVVVPDNPPANADPQPVIIPVAPPAAVVPPTPAPVVEPAPVAPVIPAAPPAVDPAPAVSEPQKVQEPDDSADDDLHIDFDKVDPIDPELNPTTDKKDSLVDKFSEVLVRIMHGPNWQKLVDK